MSSETIDYKEGKKVKIRIDKELCVSVGTCVAIANKTFKLDEDGLAEIIDADGDDLNTIVAAAQSCPTKAIEVYDSEGNKLWPKD